MSNEREHAALFMSYDLHIEIFRPSPVVGILATIVHAFSFLLILNANHASHLCCSLSLSSSVAYASFKLDHKCHLALPNRNPVVASHKVGWSASALLCLDETHFDIVAPTWRGSCRSQWLQRQQRKRQGSGTSCCVVGKRFVRQRAQRDRKRGRHP